MINTIFWVVPPTLKTDRQDDERMSVMMMMMMMTAAIDVTADNIFPPPLFRLPSFLSFQL